MTDADMIAAAIAAVEEELGRTLTSTEKTQAGRRAKNALVIIRVRFGADLSGLSADALVLVLGQIMLGRIENTTPSNVTEDSETIDDYTYRRRYSQSNSQVALLPEWWDLLSPAVEASVFSARPSFETDKVPTNVWSEIEL